MSDLTITSVSIDGDVRTFEDPVAQARANTAYEMAQEAKQAVDEFEPPETSIVTDPAWVAHANTYRGKNLGSEFTEEQKTAISSGTFDDLYVGDYWVAEDNNWRIADINYWLNTGDNICSINHLVIVPDKNMYSSAMHTGSSISNGYMGTTMYSSGLSNALSTIKSIFGLSNILKHDEFFTNSVQNGVPRGGAWVENEICLMNENMICGSKMVSSMSNGSVSSFNGETIDKNQLALFKFRQDLSSTTELNGTERESFWLRDIISSTTFSSVHKFGYINLNAGYTTSLGVRPVFGIIG